MVSPALVFLPGERNFCADKRDGVRSSTWFLSALRSLSRDCLFLWNSQCVTKLNPECDDTVDCSDGSDEAHCGQSACLNWPTGHIPFPGSAAGSAVWPTMPISCRNVGPAFTGAGQRKGGSTCDMTRNMSRKQRRESLRCVGEKGGYQADKRSWSNCVKSQIPGTGGLSYT